MKVLIQTKETQGWRANDFCFGRDGEIVMFPVTRCEEDIDGPCGCGRALVGALSRMGTTTFMAREVEGVESIRRAMFLAATEAEKPLLKRAWGEMVKAACETPQAVVLEWRGKVRVRSLDDLL